MRNLRHEELLGLRIVTCFESLYAALLSTLPGVIAAVIESRVDHIKLTLTSRLYFCREVTEAASIKKFLRFVELRPFALRICRLIPVDMTLPVGLLSLCTTYLIVLAQFSHQGQKI
ncbi:hypothetical protein EVAR_24936_1 [Eumeta japonica]|uniref:Gustatory receptor n=1 Tax=Eumeta variegata TaxID=151549 RepID=A0A4C1V692_EUMVA|nr:hypothetical protein EVAR_24936_1 [Eumeta japonica]